MASTYNRQPLRMNSSSLDYQHFNHNQWKGVTDNKNFLTVDQETFEDAKNVYMDEVGTLKSRPSIKVVSKHGLKDVLNAWKFESIEVYLTNDDSYQLTFVNVSKDSVAFFDIETDNIHLLLSEQNIYIFTPYNLYKYNIVTSVVSIATDDIYLPVLTRYVNNILTEPPESSNELISSYKEEYYYDSVFYNYDNFIDVIVDIELDDNLFENIKFIKHQELLFISKMSVLSSSSIIKNSYNILGDSNEEVCTLSISNNHTMIYSIPDYSVTRPLNVTFTCYYSTNGYIFTVLPSISNVIGFPKISKDGTYVAAFTKDGLYFYSLTETEIQGDTVVKKYPDWTDVLTDLKYDKKQYLDFSAVFQRANQLPIGERYPINSSCNGDFLSLDNFCFTCFTTNSRLNQMHSWLDDLQYSSIHSLGTPCVCVIRTKGEFTEKVISGPYYGTADRGEESSVNLTLKYYLDDSVQLNDTLSCKIQFRNNATEYKLICKNSRDDIVYETNWLTSVIRNTSRIYVTANHTIAYDSNTVSLTLFSINYYRANYTDASDSVLLFGINVPQVSMYTSQKSTNIALLFYCVRRLADENVSVDPETTAIEVLFSGIATDRDAHLYNIYLSATNNAVDMTRIQALSILALNQSCRCYDNVYAYATVCSIYKFTYYESYDESSKKYTLNKITESSAPFFSFNCAVLSNDATFVITDKALFPLLSSGVSYLQNFDKVYPIAMINNVVYIVAKINDKLMIYSSSASKNISVYKTIEGSYNGLVPTYSAELENYYITKDNILYESQYVTNEFKWYFPKTKSESFDDTICAIHPISKDELAIFFKDSIYNVSSTNIYKTKIGVGCEPGSNVITTLDGSNIIFASRRGLAAMTYQNFVATTEQSLSYLSDTISKRFSEFNEGPIKLYQYKYWIICYKQNDNLAYVYDIRNQSWWPIEHHVNVSNIITLDKPLIVANKQLYDLQSDELNYCDSNAAIEWFILSQKLHFSAINYYKHIINLTLSSHKNTDCSNNMLLQIKNYRNDVDNADIEVLDYDVNVVRNYVKRLNYSKVQEFQYKLSNDVDIAVQIPMSLSNISIKYTVTGVIR